MCLRSRSALASRSRSLESRRSQSGPRWRVRGGRNKAVGYIYVPAPPHPRLPRSESCAPASVAHRRSRRRISQRGQCDLRVKLSVSRKCVCENTRVQWPLPPFFTKFSVSCEHFYRRGQSPPSSPNRARMHPHDICSTCGATPIYTSTLSCLLYCPCAVPLGSSQ